MSDSYFEKIMKIEDKIKELCCSNQNLLKLLFYPDSNALEKPDIEDLSEVLEKNIFFNNRDLETLQDSRCLLFIKTKTKHYGMNSTNYLKVDIIFDIIVSNRIGLNDPYREEKIMSEIDIMMNASKQNIWLGKAILTDTFGWNPNKRASLRRTIYSVDVLGNQIRNCYKV